MVDRISNIDRARVRLQSLLSASEHHARGDAWFIDFEGYPGIKSCPFPFKMGMGNPDDPSRRFETVVTYPGFSSTTTLAQAIFDARHGIFVSVDHLAERHVKV